eukprot:7711651-Alexandrium_andersonii.AAC.1
MAHTAQAQESTRLVLGQEQRALGQHLGPPTTSSLCEARVLRAVSQKPCLRSQELRRQRREVGA